MQHLVFATASLVALLASLAFSASAGDDAFRDEIEHWRQKHWIPSRRTTAGLPSAGSSG